jgi:hypothetical protein
MRRISLICRSTSNVISRLCEKTIRRKCVNIKNESTFWRIWTFLYSFQLIDSISFISEIRRRFIKSYQRWKSVSSSRIEFENSRWFANTKICRERSNISKWINDCWIEKRSIRKRSDWICLMCKTIDVRTISLNALRTMNLSFVLKRKTILNHEMNQNKSSTSIKDFLEEFRNHLRIAQTLITKKTIHEAFATLQEKSSNDETTDQKRSEKFSNRKIENRSCLCDRKHSFNECYYLIEKVRSTE